MRSAEPFDCSRPWPPRRDRMAATVPHTACSIPRSRPSSMRFWFPHCSGVRIHAIWRLIAACTVVTHAGAPAMLPADSSVAEWPWTATRSSCTDRPGRLGSLLHYRSMTACVLRVEHASRRWHVPRCTRRGSMNTCASSAPCVEIPFRRQPCLAFASRARSPADDPGNGAMTSPRHRRRPTAPTTIADLSLTRFSQSSSRRRPGRRCQVAANLHLTIRTRAEVP
jgi:hypothetical protein